MIPTLLTDSVTSDLERAVHYALLWGLEAVELRSVGGPMDRVPHINEQKVRRRLLESELPAVAVAPSLFEGDVADRAQWLNDLAMLDETLRFCARLDCPRIVVSCFQGDATDTALASAARALNSAGDRAAKKNITVCVLNTEGGIASTGAALERLVGAVGHESVVAAWDPAVAAMTGEDPAEALDGLAPKVGLVRCRNVEHTGNGWEARAIDRGAVDWCDQLKRLKDAGFDGPLSLDIAAEPSGASAHRTSKSKTGLHDATALIGLIRADRR